MQRIPLTDIRFYGIMKFVKYLAINLKELILMSKEGHCPHCHKHCSLASPKCGRGKAYAKELLSKANSVPEGVPAVKPMQDTAPKQPTFSLEETLLSVMRDSAHIVHHSTESKGGRGRILALLKQSGGMSQRQIMQVVGISSAALSEVLAKLEGHGWIRRIRSDADKRNVDVTLTEDGAAEADLAIQEWEASSRALFAGITEEDKTVLLGLLQKLNQDWQSRYQDLDSGEGFRGRGLGRTIFGAEHGSDGHHGHGEHHDHHRHHGHQGKDHREGDEQPTGEDIRVADGHAQKEIPVASDAPERLGEGHGHHQAKDKAEGKKHRHGHKHEEQHPKHKHKKHHD